MPNSTVTIGGVVLWGHEVPSKIPFGGKQKIAKNVLIGGQRVPDAMGYEFCDARWEARFRGQDAKSRALAIDAMCQGGAQIEVFWGGLYRLGIIEEFEADYQREFDIPYRISIYVIDGGGGPENLGGGLGALIGADLAGMAGFIAGGLPDAVGAAIGGLSDAIAAAGPLTAVALSSVAPLQTLAETAVMAVDDALATGERAIGTALTPDPAELAPVGFARSVTETLAALQTQTGLTALRGLAGRVATNISTIG